MGCPAGSLIPGNIEKNPNGTCNSRQRKGARSKKGGGNGMPSMNGRQGRRIAEIGMGAVTR